MRRDLFDLQPDSSAFVAICLACGIAALFLAFGG